MATIWELDFYSRPVLDENNKKLWEVVICESPIDRERSLSSLYRYAEFCPSNTVNSIWLRQALEKAIQEAGETPKKIRFFRRQMNNMIAKACEDLGIPATPSRRTYVLNQWLAQRMEDFYPQQEGYDPKAAQTSSVQYPELNAVPLPDAIRGDRGDKWTFVSLEAATFVDMNEWEIGFGEGFPLEIAGVTPQTKIPGLLIFSPRSLPLSAWLSGLEIGFLQLDTGDRPRLRLESGVSDSWILANITDPQTFKEAKGFEQDKKKAKGVHFLAIQANPNSEAFAGFWLLIDPT